MAMMNAPQRAHQFRKRNGNLHQRSGFQLFGNNAPGKTADTQPVAHRVLNRLLVPQFHPQLEMRQMGQQQIIDNFTRAGALLAQDPLRLRQPLQRHLALQ